ncbi:MAG TPA: hypothetical protein VFJ17_01945 [Mycobacteriales bacterium]|jgi:hypothetical protein|nr:hypothetical protein [Mycobacteriales bacterium]
MTWCVIVALNALVFAVYLHRQGYRRKWLAVIAALFLGPLIWAWWALIRYGEHRGRKRANRAV